MYHGQSPDFWFFAKLYAPVNSGDQRNQPAEGTGPRVGCGVARLASPQQRSREQSIATPNLPPGFDFTDPDIYAHRLPVQEVAELRATAPIWWNEQPPDQGGFGDGGY
jgi:hypothetical protein